MNIYINLCQTLESDWTMTVQWRSRIQSEGTALLLPSTSLQVLISVLKPVTVIVFDDFCREWCYIWNLSGSVCMQTHLRRKNKAFQNRRPKWRRWPCDRIVIVPIIQIHNDFKYFPHIYKLKSPVQMHAESLTTHSGLSFERVSTSSAICLDPISAHMAAARCKVGSGWLRADTTATDSP